MDKLNLFIPVDHPLDVWTVKIERITALTRSNREL